MTLATGTYIQTALIQKTSLRKSMALGTTLTVQAICLQTAGGKHTDGNWYWFDNSGEMATGWKKIADKWYYFNEEGAMKTGWVKYKDTWYYLDAKEGAMVSNAFIQSADGTGWYYLKPDGTLADKPEFTVEPDG